MATVECTNCRLSSEFYFYFFKATRMRGNRTSIGFEVTFENAPECDAKKEVVIRNDKKETIKLKCGIRVYTYYAPPKAKTWFPQTGLEPATEIF
jgi:hypothetical protein